MIPFFRQVTHYDVTINIDGGALCTPGFITEFTPCPGILNVFLFIVDPLVFKELPGLLTVLTVGRYIEGNVVIPQVASPLFPGFNLVCPTARKSLPGRFRHLWNGFR